MIWAKAKLWLIGLFTAAMGLLALWGKLMANKAEKYEQKAKQAEKKAEDATELSNTYSELNRVDKKAEERKNEVLKNRDTSDPVAGRNFNRNRMHDNGDKD